MLMRVRISSYPPSKAHCGARCKRMQLQHCILDNLRWQITDDAFDSHQWIGISTGDIWLNEQEAWGFYCAKWIPNQDDDLKLMFMAVNEHLDVNLVIGFSCCVGNLESLKQDSPKNVPWVDWLGQTPIELNEFEQYSTAQEALLLAKHVIQHDRSLSKYIGLTDMSLIVFSSEIDEYGYHTIQI